MRTRLFFAPWWAQGIAPGIYFAVFMAVYSVVEDDQGWLSATISAVFGGLFFGGFMGWFAARENARWRVVAGPDLDEAELRTVRRAELAGPVPAEPRLRSAAFRAATYDAAKLARQKWAAIVLLALAPALVLLDIWTSHWWFILVPLYPFSIYQTWSQPRRLRARTALLSAPGQPG